MTTPYEELEQVFYNKIELSKNKMIPLSQTQKRRDHVKYETYEASLTFLSSFFAHMKRGTRTR